MTLFEGTGLLRSLLRGLDGDFCSELWKFFQLLVSHAFPVSCTVNSNSHITVARRHYAATPEAEQSTFCDLECSKTVQWFYGCNPNCLWVVCGCGREIQIPSCDRPREPIWQLVLPPHQPPAAGILKIGEDQVTGRWALSCRGKCSKPICISTQSNRKDHQTCAARKKTKPFQSANRFWYVWFSLMKFSLLPGWVTRKGSF